MAAMGRDKYGTLMALEAAGLPVPRFFAVSSADDVRLSDLGATFGEGRRYAVRSSAPGEDGSDRSFAGQYETLLDVPEDDVADAVRQVLASYGREVAYGSVSGSSEGCVAVVQEMVDVVFSGIAFTSNPEGFVGERVVVVGRGVGENVVSDAVDAKTWHVAGDVMWSVGDLDEEDGMPSGQIGQVLGLLDRARSVLGCETDMEFAIDAEGCVHVLQARPITVVGGMSCEEAVSGATFLDNSNIVESYPGVSLPLTQSFVRSVYERIFRAAVSRLTGSREVVDGLADRLRDMVVFCDWHAYYRMESWYAVLSLLPLSGPVKRVWRRSLGVTDVGHVDAVRFGLGTRARVLVRVLRVWRHVPRLTEEACVYVEPYLDEVERSVAGADGVAELLSLYDEMFERVLSTWDVTLFNDMYAFLNAAFSGDDFTARGTLASMAPVEAMSGLVDVARRDGIGSAAYAGARDAFVAEFGNRVVGELKLETRTWRTDSSMLDEYVASSVDDGMGHVSDAVEAVSRRGIRHTLFAGKARRGVELRERSRLLRSRMFGIVRDVFLRIGRAMVAEGALDDVRDVFYLDIDMIRGFSAGDGRDLAHEVRVRRRLEARVMSLPVVPRVRVVGDAPWVHTMPGDSAMAGEGARLASGDVLLGTGTSVGVVRGEVVRLDAGNALARATDVAGKVVVAVSTDPGWAFVLRCAAGIVAERGSLLSHTSIIARELRVPAVVAVPGVFRALRDGDVVEVDGGTGTVTVVDVCGGD